MPETRTLALQFPVLLDDGRAVLELVFGLPSDFGAYDRIVAAVKAAEAARAEGKPFVATFNNFIVSFFSGLPEATILQMDAADLQAAIEITAWATEQICQFVPSPCLPGDGPDPSLKN